MKNKILNIIIIILVAMIVGLALYLVLFNKVINKPVINGIKLNKNNIELIVGTSEKLEVTIDSKNYQNIEVIWSSIDSSIANVDDYGNVVGLKQGSTVINVTVSDLDIKDSCIVKVINPATPTPIVTPTPTPSPTPSPTPTPIPKYTIKYNSNGGSGSMDNMTCSLNEKCSIKSNTFTKKGYSFIGWTTKSDGTDDNNKWTNWSGTWTFNNGEKGITNSTLTLYAMWKDNSLDKVITRDYVLSKEFSLTGKEYDSNTLKYKVIRKNNVNRYYALIWVKNAYMQFNNGNSNYTYQYKQTHFNNEINTLGLQKKGIIGTNGGFAINNRDNIPILVTKGVYTKNENYRTTYNGKGVVYATLTMDSNNKLTYKTSSDATEMESWLKSIGARNTWAITDFTTSASQKTAVEGSDTRTSICQIDEYNFVLAVGPAARVHQELHNMFNCIAVANLDGGGSTGMYYKTSSMNEIGTIYQYKRPSESSYRKNVDILYFNE